jgi:sugar transferase (PEP-CTERM/EpsH1 system associated)
VRILFLCHRIPFPPDKGDKIRSYHELTWLARRHEVDLFTLIDDRADRPHVETLRGEVHELVAVPLRAWTARIRALRALLTGKALTVAHFQERALERALRERAAVRGYDLAFVFSSNMVPLAADLGIPLVLDFVDVDSAKFAAYAQGAPLWSRWLFAREARCLRELEKRHAESAPLTVVCTDREAAELERFCRPRRLAIVRNGTDTEYFRPGDRPGESGVVFTGAMDYRANVDAVLWFAREVWPRLRARHPSLAFTIVGSNPSPAVLAFAGRDGITVTGRVPDVRPYLRAAAVAVAPLRVARGIQNKVLEALSCGVPVVATEAALGGLSGQPRGVVVAEDPTAFADAVAGLLSDRARREALGAAGREYVVSEQRWERSLSALESLLEEVASSAGSRRVEERVRGTPDR